MKKLLYLAFAVLFFLGCSNNDDMPCVGGSCEGQLPNSSEYTGGSCNIADYGTVNINGQIWMAKNWGCYVPGSKCYQNGPANCDKYGRLYDWSTAMGIDARYNEEKWGGSDVNHRGICPSGWHLPNDDEWKDLINFVGGSDAAGTKLKATNGWAYMGCDNGEDTFGFSALPGGMGYAQSPRDNFRGGGFNGFWWSASEYNGNHAGFQMTCRDFSTTYGGTTKTSWFSVRCTQNIVSDVQDSSSSVASSSSSVQSSSSNGSSSSSETPESSSSSGLSSSIPSSSSIANSSSGISCDMNYRTVQIGDQIWMAENLNCNIPSSKCYGNDPANCAIYGRLYTWLTAMNLPSNCYSNSCSSQIGTKHQGICPSGWHIPSSEDWDKLYRYADGTNGTSSYYESTTAGRHLKATSGWNSDGNGQDTYGFSALPGGDYSGGNSFYDIGKESYWWTASESGNNYAQYRSMTYNKEGAYYSGNLKGTSYSIRCVQD